MKLIFALLFAGLASFLQPQIFGQHLNAVQIVKSVSENSEAISMDAMALTQILMDPLVANKKIVPVAIAGPYRKGKSFLMNFLVRYLRHRTLNAADDWLDPKKPLQKYFDFRGGSVALTKGIWIFPEPFLVRNEHGEEVVLLLMDSQGSWDPETNVRDNTVMFALTSLVSSTLIFNIKENIGNDHLHDLQFFTNYGEMVLQNEAGTDADAQQRPFQSLIFMVRDWENIDEKPYGFSGGQQLLEQNLRLNNSRVPEEVRKLREDIRGRLFSSVQAFLMPHPGKTVARGRLNSGNLSRVDADFLAQVRAFAENVFAPRNLKIKTINGRFCTGRELNLYFQTYFLAFESGKLPEPKSIYEATVEANNVAAKSEAKTYYSGQMKENINNGAMGSEQLRNLHDRFKAEAIQKFNSAKKMGGNQIAQRFQQALVDELEEIFYNDFVAINKALTQYELFSARKTSLEQELKELNEKLAALDKSLPGNGKLIEGLKAQIREKKEQFEDASRRAERAYSELELARQNLRRREDGFWSLIGKAIGKAIVMAVKTVARVFAGKVFDEESSEN